MKVLIVDDRPDNQLLLREQLRTLEIDPVTADSGVRALREMRAQRFDLVISDLLMPEMDGFQLCYLLKTDPTLHRTPVVIYTANYATKKDEEQAKELGADDFITRPIDEEQLTRRIKVVMQRSQSGDIAQPRTKPEGGFFREYSTLLIEKLEDQLITAEENARLLTTNADLQNQLTSANAGLQAANRELRTANEDLEAFGYSVSHDLRTPVRAIEGMFALLLRELGPLSPEARDYVNRIEFNLRRMNTLITGLLAHSRMRTLDGGARVELDQAVDAAVKGLEFAVKEAGARVRIERPLPAVMGDEQALVQVVTNLVANGIKYVGPGVVPEITIGAERKAGRVRVIVRDNGIGIAPALQPRLFQVFERLHPKSGYPGSGLGLAIVRRGVEKMGGAVGVESTPGAGSTFWFELNAAPEAGRATEPREATA